MNRDQEIISASVTEGSNQAEEVGTGWYWTEPSVWTERMLTTLEHGVKGGTWFSLIDKVWRNRNLQASYEKVRQNGGSAGTDNVSIGKFSRNLPVELALLSQQLQQGTYQPRAVKRVYIPKLGGGKRPLGIPTVRDRVVQGALRHVIEPIFERTFASNSYGFRPGRSAKDALREVDGCLRQGWQQVVDVDIKGYFDTIPHAPLLQQVAEQISDGRILKLIEQFLQQPVREGTQETVTSCGTPQGGIISPLLANIYLNPLDHELARRGYQVIRYADDMVILCREASQAQEALQVIETWMTSAGLQLHPEKTRIVDMGQAGSYFDFLGYRFQRNVRTGQIDRRVRPQSIAKLRERLRPYLRRGNGHSLPIILKRIRPILQGWYGYFKHARTGSLTEVDGWVRMRLRSILRRRIGGKGRGRGRDHHRWPNNFFTEQGLFSLTAAQALERQSVYR